jgi:hypothetical protein
MSHDNNTQPTNKQLALLHGGLRDASTLLLAITLTKNPVDNYEIVCQALGQPGTTLAGFLRQGETLVFAEGVREDDSWDGGMGRAVRDVSKPEALQSILTDRALLLHGSDRSVLSTAVARMVLASALPAVRELHEVRETPFVHAGAVVDTPGFHAESGTLYQPAEDWSGQTVPVFHTADEAEAAKARLSALLDGYVFEDASDRRHALAAILAPAIRDVVGGVSPMFVVSGPDSGCGKTLLATVVAAIWNGRADLIPVHGGSAEMRKAIQAELISERASAVMLLDNIETEIGGGALLQLLTSERWSARALGSSRIHSGRWTTTLVATGINATISSEMIRRSAVVRVLPNGGRHHDTDRDLLGSTLRDRWSLMCDAIALARWHADGDVTATDGVDDSFSKFWGLAARILGCVGTPLGRGVGASSEQRDLERDVLAAIHAVVGGESWSVADLVRATQNGWGSPPAQHLRHMLDAFIDDGSRIVSRTEGGRSRALGLRLARLCGGRPLDGLALRAASKGRSAAKRYVVVAGD